VEIMMNRSPVQRACLFTAPSFGVFVVVIFAIVVIAGCTEQNDTIPVVPIGVDYDTTMMALIPAGTFRMGNSTDHPDGDANEKPVHEVTITRPFLMGRTEVTQALYEAVMGSKPGYFNGPNLPVERVSWYDAVEFCNTLSRREGLDTCYSGNGASIVCDFMANGYRLPTEAEWEYACRAGTGTDFHTGNMMYSNTSPLDPALDEAGWYGGNSGSATHPVGKKNPNAYGLYDMHGNVWEWCWDGYEIDYNAPGPAVDPRGPTTRNRVVGRGGSWCYPASYCRSASRVCDALDSRDLNFGFRLVRTY
jgi:formylglycine-generating enzyme